MEKVYLKETEKNWHSEKVNLEKYFDTYSVEYCKVINGTNLNFYEIFEAVVDDSNINKKEVKKSMQEIREIRKKFKTKLPNFKTLERRAKELTESTDESNKTDLHDKQDLKILQPLNFNFPTKDSNQDSNQKCVKQRINDIYNNNVKNPLSKTSINRLKLKKLSKNKNTTFMKNIFTSRGQLYQDKEVNKKGMKNLQQGKTFLVTFRVYEPFHQRGRSKVGTFQQEVILLADQTLTQLRDKIICPSDFQDVRGDISHKPDSSVTVLSRDKYKSAMFYFDNTFYVDERGDRDYSEVIRQWALRRGINVGPTQNMGSMTAGKLEIRFGYPYVYMHQGSCEHLIVIKDARLLSGKCSLDSEDYPLISRIPRTQTKYCFTCLKRPVKWLVFGCENLPLDITFLCPKCFISFNYINGEKNWKF